MRWLSSTCPDGADDDDDITHDISNVCGLDNTMELQIKQSGFHPLHYYLNVALLVPI